MKITESEKQTLFSLVKGAIEFYSKYKKNPEFEIKDLPMLFHEKLGVFVTLYFNNELRGCIGRFEPQIPLAELAQKMAIAAANNDPRFSPVTKEEIPKLEIEISVLSPMQKIQSIEEIEIGKHGIYIIDGMHRGTLLPQVAVKQGWDVEEFVSYCAEKKAGLPKGAWKTAELYTYTSTILNE
jgi:AmmeMemoRadiSam system protein A